MQNRLSVEIHQAFLGVAWLMAGAIAGLFWDRFGTPVTFQDGSIFGMLVLVVLVLKARCERGFWKLPAG